MTNNKAIQRIAQALTHLVSQGQEPYEKSQLAQDINSLLSANQVEEASRKALSAFLQPPKYRANALQRAVLETAERRAIEVDGTNVETYVWNSSGRTSVILSHGFGTSAGFLAPIIQHLSSRSSHRLVAVDHAAHGASAGKEASLGHFILVLKSIILDDMTKGREISALVGHSVGATALIMLLSTECNLFGYHSQRPSLVALNPPLQPTTLMQAFCVSNSISTSLVDEMRAAFVPSPEDIFSKEMAKGAWAKGLKILLVQDAKDVVAIPGETDVLAAQLSSGEASITFEKTAGLGHFKVVADERILALIKDFVG